MSFEGLRWRTKAQELSFTREQDKMAIKSIRESLVESGKLEQVQQRMKETMNRESDGDVLAEVSAARVAGKFDQSDLPTYTPVTIRPMRYAPTAAGRDLEDLIRPIPMPKSSTLQVAAGSYHDMMRGRYRYINEFMESMNVEPEERRPMTKREEMRLEKQLAQMRANARYIGGAFLGGTALLVFGAGAGWYYTKWKLGVRDTKEYAEKMRELTPDVMGSLEQGFLGSTMRNFKLGFQTWLEGSSLKEFSRSLQGGMSGLQDRAAVIMAEEGVKEPAGRRL